MGWFGWGAITRGETRDSWAGLDVLDWLERPSLVSEAAVAILDFLGKKAAARAKLRYQEKISEKNISENGKLYHLNNW